VWGWGCVGRSLHLHRRRSVEGGVQTRPPKPRSGAFWRKCLTCSASAASGPVWCPQEEPNHAKTCLLFNVLASGPFCGTAFWTALKRSNTTSCVRAALQSGIMIPHENLTKRSNLDQVVKIWHARTRLRIAASVRDFASHTSSSLSLHSPSITSSFTCTLASSAAACACRSVTLMFTATSR